MSTSAASVQVRIRGYQFSISAPYALGQALGEAEVLHLNARTVREYVHLGKVEGRIIGGRWRFRRADLDAFFENAPSSWDFAGKNGHGD